MSRGGSRVGRFWADLTGASDRWGRTILYGVIFSRVAIIPILIALGLLAASLPSGGEDPLDGFSGRIESFDAVAILSALIFAPLIESLLIAVVVWLTAVKLRWPAWSAVVAVLILVLPLHGLVLASLLVVPFFGLMTLIQWNWTRRGDDLGGSWVVTTLHALSNASALLTTWMMRMHINGPDPSTVIK